MPEFFLELGCEELPASFVRRAIADLAGAVTSRLAAAGIDHEVGNPPIGTPRRLIVHLVNVAERQPDQQKEQRGPSLTAAYNPEGQPTPALQGFCRGQGVAVEEVEQRDGYVWVRKTIPGKPTPEVLASLLPEAILSMSFDKSMRWANSRARFARPIRWIVAVFDGQVVPFEVEGVVSSSKSRGHRFDYPEEFEALAYDQLVDGLLKRRVEPDPAEREKTIREGLALAAKGVADVSDSLVEENVFLTEWPVVIEGEFAAEYLELPEPVLVTAMAKHEKMFPVRGNDGKLLNRYLFVKNGGDATTVAEGASWVLSARFNDARFFFEEDRKHKLDDFLARTERLVFQEKLGTVRSRADRLSTLARRWCSELGGDSHLTELAAQAGLYAKADLSSGLVGELASLQGIVGGLYAEREGIDPVVCAAISVQYDLAAALKLAEPARTVALSVIAADQIDKLAGYLGLGLVPSGSSDPFGLRRAVTLLIELAWQTERTLPSYAGILRQAAELYRTAGVAVDAEAAVQASAAIFAGRYEALLPDARHDLLDAAVRSDSVAESMRPQGVRRRLELLGRLADDTAFVQTATRPLNILKSAVEKGIPFVGEGAASHVDLDCLDSEPGRELFEAVKVLAFEMSDPAAEVDALKSLEGPINRFFDSTMVMVEDEKVRTARLNLLSAVGERLRMAGDWTKIVIGGA